MSNYQVGSLCEDCLSHGLQNYLKPFYINLEEQIIKCESSRCMFPYLSKPKSNPFPDSKPSESILSLDEFIEESFNQINGKPDKSEPQQCTTKKEEIPIMFDFSSLFMDNPVKTEEKGKPIFYATTSTVNSWKTKDLKSFIKDEAMTLNKNQPAPKARISRCLSDVKSSSFMQKTNSKKSKSKRMKNDPVLVIEPQSGKPMRPLDLIKFYMKTEDNQVDADLDLKKYY